MFFNSDPYYSDKISSHLIWHPIYLGLSAHPDSLKKYGITPQDKSGDDFAKNKSLELFGTKDYLSLGGYNLYEKILKDEFINILKHDTDFVFKSYFYKLKLYLDNYFSPLFGVTNYLFSWKILIIICVGSLLNRSISLKRSFSYIVLFLFVFSFSLLPSLLYLPSIAIITDPALLFTAILYLILSLLVSYVIKQYLLFKKKVCLVIPR